LTKPPIEKAVKYTLWFAGIGFGVGIAVGIVASALSWLPLFGQLISITLVLALGVNLLISWIINRYLPQYRTPKWYWIAIIKAAISLLGVLSALKSLDLFSAMWM